MWQSGFSKSINTLFEHKQLFATVHQSVEDTIRNMKQALDELQLEIVDKLQMIELQQQLILQTSQPKDVDEFTKNVQRIEASLDVMTTHAINLNHIKLTVRRLSLLVSAEGSLPHLVLPLLPQMGPQVLRETPHQRYLLKPLREKIDATFFTPQSLPEIRSKRECQPGSTCFVFYLPPRISSGELKAMFDSYGTVLNAYVAMDKETNKSRGFGFVDFAHATEAQAAIAGLDKLPLDGKILSVSIKV